MTEEQTLAVLRAAERTLLVALTWLPYPSDVIDANEKMKQQQYTHDLQLARDGDLIRKHLAESEAAVLNIAETKGSKH